MSTDCGAAQASPRVEKAAAWFAGLPVAMLELEHRDAPVPYGVIRANGLMLELSGARSLEELEERFPELWPGEALDLLRQAGQGMEAGGGRWTCEVTLHRLDDGAVSLCLSFGADGCRADRVLVAAQDLTALRQGTGNVHAIISRLPAVCQAVGSLDELYARIHGLVRDLMSAENLYIALHDPETGLVSFPYWSDEADLPPPPRGQARGLTEYVIRTGKPALVDTERLQQLVAEGEVDLSGTQSKEWLGVPLMVQGRILGVLAVQSYSHDRIYHEREFDILSFVSGQIAQAIDRARLDQARSHLAAIVESSEDAIYSCDLEGRIISWNAGAERLYGYRKNEVLGRHVRLLAPPTRQHEPRDFLAALFRGETLSRYETVRIRKDGSPVDVSLTLSALRGPQGQVLATSTIVSDITDRRQEQRIQSAMYHVAEAALATMSLDEFFVHVHGTVSELMPADNFYIALHDARSGLVSFPYMVDQSGDHPTPHKGRRGLTEYVLRTARPILLERDQVLELAARGEIELLGTLPREWMGVPLGTDSGLHGVLAVQGYQEDRRYTATDLQMLAFVSSQVAMVIERKRNEDSLRSRESLLSRAQAIGRLGVFEVDVPAWKLEWSPENDALWGRRPEDGPPTFQALSAMVHPDDRQAFLEATGRMLEESVPFDLEYRIVWADGSIRHVAAKALPTPGPAGRAVRVTGINQDVTERRRMEEQLREREANYRLLADNALDVIWVWGTDGGNAYISPSVFQLLGFTPDEYVKQPLADLMTPESLARFRDHMLRARAGEDISEVPIELELHRKDGSCVWVEMRAKALRDADGRITAYQGASRDISDRKAMEQEARLREHLLRQMFEVHGAIMLLIDPETLRITDANRSARGYYGFTPERMPNVRLTDIDALPETVLRQELEEAATGSREVLSGRHLVASGEQRDVDVRVSAIRNVDGHRYFAIVQDTTKRRRAEEALRESEARYRHLAEENAHLLERSRHEAEVKSLLLEEVNHRVKNNLSAIMGMLEMESQNASERNSGSARSFMELQDRIYALATVHELLSAGEWSPLSLADLCPPLIHGSLANTPSQHQIQVDIEAPTQPIRVSPRVATTLAVILSELTTNSGKYAFSHREGGRIRVVIRPTGDTLGRVELCYSDDGPGFPLDAIRGRRENIGLKLIRLNVKNLPHGELSMSNQPGASTTLTFQPIPILPAREVLS